METPLIECKELRHNYGDKEVLHGLNFSVGRGGLVGLLGKNGAGKSTTINILMGFLQPSAGVCSVLGHPCHAIPPEARGRIGLLHEGFIQYDFMTIEQIERFYAAFYPRWNRDLYYDLVSRLNVPYSRRVTRLSCGQRSQVTLGLILAQMPELMILDDFSMGLDVGYRRLFLEFLRDYVAENATTVLLTSHIVQELDRFLDHLLIVQEGRVIAEGTRDEFMSSFYQYDLPRNESTSGLGKDEAVVNVEAGTNTLSLFSFLRPDAMRAHLAGLGLGPLLPDRLEAVPMSFEDAFVGLTGRY